MDEIVPSASPDRSPELRAPTLRETQAAFQRAVMMGDKSVLSDILDNSRTTGDVLFGVYRHAYTARLIEVVRNDHRLLNLYLGDEAFSELARAYVKARPSRTPNARWFSHRFPEFLAELKPANPVLFELAALEKAVNDAFDAPDAPAMAMSDLAVIPPEQWPNLVFIPHPSARCVVTATNAYSIWSALKDDELPPPLVDLAEQETMLIWRQETIPKVRRISAEEAMMWNEAHAGKPFGALCELLAIYDNPESAPVRAAQYLQGWIFGGLLTH